MALFIHIIIETKEVHTKFLSETLKEETTTSRHKGEMILR
jgi:hypothetical protein